MKELKNLSYTFSKNAEPEAHALPGDVVCFDLVDCFNGSLKSEAELAGEIKDDNVNAITGPLYVDGAEPGDALAVEILDIAVDDHGWSCTVPGLGVLEHEQRTHRIEVKDGYCIYKDVKWPVNTMIGTIGCPVADRDVPSVYVFEGGGNMDSRKIVKGVTLWLPVRVKGGLLGMGDLHATMGDGEVIGTGVEISGKVTVRVGLVKNFLLNWPVTETAHAYFVNTRGETCDAAITAGYKEMQRLLAQAYGWDLTDTAMYMSMQGYVEANQACISPDEGGDTFRVGTPKVASMPRLIPWPVLKD